MKNNNLKTLFISAIVIICAAFLMSCVPVKERPQPQIPVKMVSSAVQKEDAAPQPKWTEVPSLKDEYTKYFDYIGLAVPENQLTSDVLMQGLSYQVNCFTCENECKPDFIFNWAKPTSTTYFTSEDGNEYKVPVSLAGFSRLEKILGIAKKYGMIMRGHVLVWHGQTPDWFFKEDYSSEKSYVDKATMTARQEWYIKSVLEFVKAWEDKNNDGKHIIVVWDVVNEACTDGGWTDDPLRTASPWYSIYGDDTFIVNAFRFANKYAPADVKLAYNDYSSYAPNKTKAICRVVQDIQAASDARIDVVGMQSHVSMSYPTVADYETAVNQFLALGVDVQVTEMEIAFGGRLTTQEALKDRYVEYFKMFLKYRKVPGKNGISGITLWGTKDEVSWIRNNADEMNKFQRPLLFEKDYECKPAFFGVLETAQNFKE